MKVLVVKLSSLGDVVHAMPAVQDMRQALPDLQIDWVAESGFAPLVARCEGVQRVIESDIRSWRKSPLSPVTRRRFRAFRQQLQAERYDAVIDLQGLTKSAFVSWLARVAGGGKRFALGNQTEGAGYENPTRWVADVAIRLEPHVHAVERSRQLCARALGYEVPAGTRYGLSALAVPRQPAVVALAHGTSRADKLWPEPHWIELGHRLMQSGYGLALPHGNDEEEARSQRLAREFGKAATVWPRLALDDLARQLGHMAGVIGVDSGLSHIAVALDLPHVQIYNFDTAWRTGPVGSPHQVSVYAQPAPGIDSVWAAWREVAAA
ncbi:MAG: lipopolysaccharide heptosyltransferase I [Comamonadaceae bacterium]|nr:MAG: lipopolysaccharide heptosyltransferase I [Comamonadaceae bacterium]